MGTRYNITYQDLCTLGIEDQVELIEYEDQWYDECGNPSKVEVFRHKSVGICGWAFDACEDGDIFTGPNIGKPELSALFRKYDIQPDYY